jgi:hypothetical protein
MDQSGSDTSGVVRVSRIDPILSLGLVEAVQRYPRTIMIIPSRKTRCVPPTLPICPYELASILDEQSGHSNLLARLSPVLQFLSFASSASAPTTLSCHWPSLDLVVDYFVSLFRQERQDVYPLPYQFAPTNWPQSSTNKVAI